jgi:signal transduction histidine kinase
MALASVSNAQATRGLRTDLQADQSHLPLSVDAVDAVAAAAGEALANVRKHANTDRAVVSVRPADAGVLVTIADGGCGFDPAVPTAGLGIAQSIQARMRQAGGRARLHSAPGQGTCVELWVPAPSQPRDHEPGQRK